MSCRSHPDGKWRSTSVNTDRQIEGHRTSQTGSRATSCTRIDGGRRRRRQALCRYLRASWSLIAGCPLLLAAEAFLEVCCGVVTGFECCPDFSERRSISSGQTQRGAGGPLLPDSLTLSSSPSERSAAHLKIPPVEAEGRVQLGTQTRRLVGNVDRYTVLLHGRPSSRGHGRDK